MESPQVKNTLRFKREKITFHVMAYRKLTKDELENSVRLFLDQLSASKRKKLLGSEVIIRTQFGITPGL
jgi:hypothetical protein